MLKERMQLLASVTATLLLAAALTGCGVPLAAPGTHAGNALGGTVQGGQQPVSGAIIQLYGVSTTADGGASTPLLAANSVTTGADGSFHFLPSAYSCNGVTDVYLTATGGNPGGGTNANLALMTALGPCSALTANTFISVNELTTVAATSALFPYMTSYTAVGSTASDSAALANAFGLAAEFVDTASGTSPGAGVPAGMMAPTLELNTLANVMATCINSGGLAVGSTTSCSMLFALTPSSAGAAPTNTIAAMLNIATNPTQNTSSLYQLATPAGPFQPTLTAPPATFAAQLMPMAGTSTLTVDPSGLSFPSTAVGFTAQPMTVALQNTGSLALAVNSIAVSGSSASEFAQTNTCGTSLAAGANCTASLTFTPAAAGPRSASLVVSSSAAGSPQSIPLTGTGGNAGAGPITLAGTGASPTSFNTSGTIKDFTLSNYGTTGLTIRGVSLATSYFSIENNTCGTYLAAQSVCTISVRSTGFFYTSINFSYTSYNDIILVDDDAAAGPTTLAISSHNTSEVYNGFSAYYPGPMTIGYGAWPIGYTQTGMKLTADSGSSYQGVYLSVSLAGTNAGDFAVPTSSCTYYPVTSPANCSVGVSFTPTAAGLRSAMLVVNGNGYVRVTGTGDAPGPSLTITYNSSTYIQGQAVTNASNIAITTDSYTILDNGSVPMTPIFQVTGTSAANYSTSNNCSQITLRATCMLLVTFTSSSVGKFSAVINVSDYYDSYTASLPLATTASYAQVSNASVAFNVYTGSTTVQSFTITNGSLGGPLGHAVTISKSGTGLFTTDVTSCPASSTMVCTVNVTFAAPTIPGITNDFLTVTDLLSGNMGTVGLQGKAVARPTLSLSASSVNFPARAVGTTSIPMNVIVTNSGVGNLTVSSVSVSGAVNGNFTQTNNCASVAAGGGTCSIAIAFAPTATGMQAAAVQIVSDAASSPNVIALIGSTN